MEAQASPHRAFVERDFGRGGIAIHLAVRTDDGMRVAAPARVDFARVAETVQTAPFIRLDDALGRALFDALAEYYGGTNGVQTLRGDLLHERGRVDLLIKHVIGASHDDDSIRGDERTRVAEEIARRIRRRFDHLVAPEHESMRVVAEWCEREAREIGGGS